jgi:hypothetical protein
VPAARHRQSRQAAGLGETPRRRQKNATSGGKEHAPETAFWNPGGGSTRLTSRSSARQWLRKCYWPSYLSCAPFDFGVFPEETDWVTFAEWRDVFDRFPLLDSPGYHTFRRWYGWEPAPVQRRLGIPAGKAADLHEGRTDPCKEMV